MARVRFWAAVALVALVGCKAATKTSSTPTLASVQVQLDQPSVAEGRPDNVSATAVYSDGSRLDVSVHATWGSSAPFVATVGCNTNSCQVTTGNLGTVTLTATYEGKFGTATLDVVPALAVTLSAAISDSTIPKGTTSYIRALSDFSDTSTFDVSTHTTWTSSDDTIATVTCTDEGCAANGLSLGAATLTATFSGLTSTVDVTVVDPVVESVTLANPLVTLTVGAMQSVVLTGVYSDMSTSDVTATATWVSSDTAVATVVKGAITAVGGGMATITASFGSEQATLTVVVEAHQTGVVITTVTPTVPLGKTFQLGADAVFEGNVHIPVGTAASWTSSDTTVATISTTGLVSTGGSGRTMGTTTITATYPATGTGFSDTTMLTVGAPVAASVSIAALPTLHASDAPYPLSTQVIDSNGGTSAPVGAVTYAVANEGVATVDSNGLLSPKSPGNTTVTATADGVTGTATVHVEGALSAIVISPRMTTISAGAAVFTASAFYAGASGTSPLTEDVTWTSDAGLFFTVTQASRAQVLAGCNTSGTWSLTATVTLASGTMLSDHATVTCP
jgi:hypothetical protein